jgi:transposase
MGKSITDLSSVTTVGLDLAKHVFQVHGAVASGRVIVAKAFRRKDVLAFFAQLPEWPRRSGSKAGKKNAKIFWNVVLDV